MKVHLNLQSAPNQTSGIGVYTHEIAKRLAVRPDVEVTGGFNSLRTRSVPLFDSCDFPVRMSRVPERLLYDTRAFRATRISYNAMMRDRSEVSVFFSNRLPGASIRGAVVAVVHDLIPLRIDLELPGIAKRYSRQLEDIRQRAELIVTVSEWSKNDIVKETGIAPDRIAVVPNGVDADLFMAHADNEGQAHVRKRYGLPDRFVLYFGGTRPYKNVARLIEAYSLVDAATRSRVKLVITRQDPDMESRAAALGIADSVIFTPPIRDQDKSTLYQLAEVSVLVSLYEGFGIPVIEAMAAGTPVVASNVSSLPEVCGGAAILVDPHDPQALAHSLEQVLEDPDLRNSMVAAGRANVRRFSWDASAEQFATLLARVGRI